MIREKITSEKIHIRILYFTIIFFITFFGITIMSYFILPNGFLLNQNNLKDFHTSSNLIVSTLQIFLFNMISIIFIVIGSIFSKKKKQNEEFVSLGYLCFIIFISINAITLGTWSFSINVASVPLFERIIGMFNITKNAGLVEMYGQLLITCSLANKYLVMTFKNITTTRSIKTVSWNKQEVVCLLLGIILMVIGALIESNSILILR
ncbi:MAG: hypothetical protein PHW32_01105 [Bacilli bacterium]|nr:hypothetical protein [Bacilli bacterium]MDD4719111.1 hypothetical protein [Bacilli bacterium]